MGRCGKHSPATAARGKAAAKSEQKNEGAGGLDDEGPDGGRNGMWKEAMPEEVIGGGQKYGEKPEVVGEGNGDGWAGRQS